ncbi:MAG: NTP transferase domain-containing protein [Ferruginibacter sp.]
MQTTALYGIVAAGGISRRMGKDKSQLIYHQLEQRYHVYEMLVPLCQQVHISCNAIQAPGISYAYNCMVDEVPFAGNGPISALLTAFRNFPGADILLIGCDYPYLDSEAIKKFIESLGDETLAAAFYNENKKMYEPVLAYYRYTCAKELTTRYKSGQRSLRHFLQNVQAGKYQPDDARLMKSIDTKGAMEEAKHFIHHEH